MTTRGSQFVELEVLKDIPLPPATDTYTPLSHYDLSQSLRTISQDILSGLVLIRESYEVARDGKQMFGVLTFNASNGDIGLSVGFRNSLDRSMSVGMCIGAQVLVCSNMAFSAGGDGIVVMKRHSKNLMEVLETTAITTLYKATYTFNQLIRDADAMRQIGMDNEQAFKMLGLLFGHGLLTPRQLTTAHKEWLSPSYREFEPRNLFSMYNACTEAMKQNAPVNTLERHIKLHDFATQCVTDNLRSMGAFW